jgi:hypothetical protein
MHAVTTARLVQGLIPIVAGIGATLMGHRVIGKPQGVDAAYDAWHARFGKLFKAIGPFIAFVGFLKVTGLIR